MTPRKTWAILLVVSGLILVFVPDFVFGPSSDLSVFDQVERRIPGGALLGWVCPAYYVHICPVTFSASVLCWLCGRSQDVS